MIAVRSIVADPAPPAAKGRRSAAEDGPHKDAGRSRRWVAGVLGLLLLAGLLAYGNALTAPFVYDDGPAILTNPSIRRLAAVDAVLRPPPHLTTSGRPIVNLTLALNYVVGGTQVTGYHVINLAIHLACGALLFGVARRTLSSRRLRERFGLAAEMLAGAVALLWLLHPLTTESVTYVIQRAESLAALFYLLTLYGYIRGAETGARGWFGVAVLSCWAGMATKEVMVSAPLIVFVYDRIFLAESFRAAWQRRRGWYLALGLSWGLLAMLVAGTGGSRDGSAGFGQGVTIWAYALTQVPAILRYLWLSAWPHPLVFDYGNGLVTPTLAGWFGALGLAGLALVAVVAAWRGSVLGFVALFFAALLAPSSSVVPVVTETVAEHRMYLPLAGLIAAAVALAYRAFGRRGIALAIVAALLLGSLTHRRNRDYATVESLWADTVAKAPTNPRAHNQLGFQLADRGETTAALAQYRAAVAANANDADGHYNLGTALFRLGRANDALPELATAVRLSPNNADNESNYGLVLAQLGRTREAIDRYAAALRIDPANAVTHNDLGVALAQTGQMKTATDEFEAALRLRPDYAEAHNNLGHAYGETGRTADALAEFEAALSLTPDYAEAHNNLARLLDDLGRPGDAMVHFQAVARLAPGYADAHYRIGNDLAALGRPDEAVREWQETIRLDPTHVLARAALGRYGHSDAPARPDATKPTAF